MNMVTPVRLLDEFRNRRRELLRLGGPGVLATMAAFALALYFVKPAPPASIVIATGKSGGRYHAFGNAYARSFAENGIEGNSWIR